MEPFEIAGEELLKVMDQRNLIFTKKRECIDRLKDLYFESKNCPINKVQEYWAVSDYYWKEYEQLELERIQLSEKGAKLGKEMTDSYHSGVERIESSFAERIRKIKEGEAQNDNSP
ncbi:hypothetical protein [Larkinella punicea]|uniref:Uncharacterized protein n=1 Tax=Larkinella punicea TaxID=2315727 RepID=A0A368JLX5_9BACT|nr:hypothetical protein [Larkinella punicea]RCR68295.1 hypothetical protein DUE52_18035 [Larkinella punicea]